MTATANTLPFTAGRPSDYLPLADEPTFDAGQHPALECLPSVISPALFVGGWRRVQLGATVNPKIYEGTLLA